MESSARTCRSHARLEDFVNAAARRSVDDGPRVCHQDNRPSIERVSAEIAERVRSFEPIIEPMDAIPSIGRRVAEVLVAESARI
jgi:hypothetical protein